MRSFPSLLLAAILAFAAAAKAQEAKRGKEIYERCAGCHSLSHDRVGPKHCNVLGRRAGSVAGFEYSEALQRSGIVWDEKALDRFLENPLKVVPGTSMTYAGVSDPRERADLIAYLRTATCPGR